MKKNNTALKKRILSTLSHEISAVSDLSKSVNNILLAVQFFEERQGGKIILTGMGKSSFVAMKIAATLTSLGRSAVFLHPVDALHGDSGMVHSHDTVIAISYSGGSAEIVTLIKHLKKEFHVGVVSITGNTQSLLAKLSEVVIPIKIVEEGSPHNLAPMSSTTASLVVGDLIAAGLVSTEVLKKDTFAQFHPGGSLGLTTKKVKEKMSVGRSVPVARSSGSFQKAVLELNKKHKGIVALVDSLGRLEGVISAGDISRFFNSHDSIVGVLAKDVMTMNPKTSHESDSLKSALDHMQDKKITTLFVVNKKHTIVGIIHMHDIVDVAL